MAILVHSENLPFRYGNPAAELPFCSHLQVVEVGKYTIYGDAENRDLQERGTEECLRIIPISAKEVRPGFYEGHINGSRTCRYDFREAGESDIGVTKRISLRVAQREEVEKLTPEQSIPWPSMHPQASDIAIQGFDKESWHESWILGKSSPMKGVEVEISQSSPSASW